MHDVSAGPTAVLIPVKAFHRAKARLATHLGSYARTELARELAGRVVRAAGDLAPFVVCDDDAVARWATAMGAEAIRQRRPGLDAAVTEGVAVLAAAGFDWVVVAHGDLPLARELASTTGFDGVTLVPDRHDDGTNVVTLPSRCGFRFAYGPASFSRHLQEARRLGLAVRVLRDPALGWDVDVPEDLAPGVAPC